MKKIIFFGMIAMAFLGAGCSRQAAIQPQKPTWDAVQTNDQELFAAQVACGKEADNNYQDEWSYLIGARGVLLDHRSHWNRKLGVCLLLVMQTVKNNETKDGRPMHQNETLKEIPGGTRYGNFSMTDGQTDWSSCDSGAEGVTNTCSDYSEWSDYREALMRE